MLSRIMRIQLLLVLAISACTPFKLYDPREDAAGDERDERAENSSDTVSVADSADAVADDQPAAMDVIADATDVSSSDVSPDTRPDAPSCTDGIQNGTETDIDCGGTCRACAVGRHCTGGLDCLSSNCTSGVCASCANGIMDWIETGVDCGGGVCPACVVGQRCLANSDCVSASCPVRDASSRICASVACNDGVIGGAETDVDCGGGVCSRCSLGRICRVGADCVSTRCVSGSCGP
jgi:hypothetical protein